MASVLITGAYGYLGARIAKFLLSQNHSVRLYGRKKPTNFSLTSAEVHEGDILDEAAVARACSEMDSVIHLAAADQQTCKGDPSIATKINVEGTKILLDQASRQKIKKFLFFSTFHVYGNTRGTIAEDTKLSPSTTYAKNKLDAESLCNKKEDVQCTIFRLSNAYGLPLFNSGWDLAIHDFCKQSILKKKIILRTTGEQKRDFVAVSDVEQAVHLFLTKNTSEVHKVYNLGGEKSMSISESAKIVAQEATPLIKEEVVVDFVENPVKEENGDFSFNIERIKKLGFKPTANFREEVKNILCHLKKTHDA